MRAFKRGAAALAIAAALAATFGFAAGAHAQVTLRVIPNAEVTNFDPIVEVTTATVTHANLIYDMLYSLDAAGQPQPQMAEGHTLNPAGNVYTITLREGLKFHDGTPVTAADAVASIKRWAKRDTLGRKLLDLGLDAKAVDARTFTVATTRPTPLVLTGLARQAAYPLVVMREKDAQNEPTQRVTANIGSGPFRFVQSEYVPGSRIVYERNKDYVPRGEAPSYLAGGKKAQLDRIEFKIVNDPSTAAAALMAGEVDVYESPPPDLLPMLQRAKDVHTHILDKGGKLTVLRPNMLQPPFDKVEARRALMLAVNQPDYVHVAGAGDAENARECYAFFSCGAPTSSEAGMEKYRKQNLQAARELLQASGYKGEPVIVMHPMDYPPASELTPITVEEMKKAGFNVQVVQMDWATLTQRRANKGPAAQGGWNLFLTTNFSYNMTAPPLNFYLSSGCGGTGGWFGWPCDPKMDELRDRWDNETDLAKRKALDVDIQKQAVEYVPYVPVVQAFTRVAYRSNVQGLLETPTLVFWNVRKQ